MLHYVPQIVPCSPLKRPACASASLWLHLPQAARCIHMLHLQLMVSACCAQIYAIYDYQVKYAVRLATENPYVPTFGADIPGGPPGLGVRMLT